MNDIETSTSKSASNLPLLIIALATVGVHAATCTLYVRELNEYYFLELARHLDWGYVDVAPLGPLIFKLGDLLGGGLFATRIFSILAGGAAVYCTGLIAQRLGGGTFARCLAAVAVALASFFVRGTSSMSLFAWEPIFWAAASLLFVLILTEDRDSLWPALGLVLGLGVLLKPTVLLCAGGIGAGLLIAAREKLKGKGPWMAAAIVLLLLAPFVAWMAAHNWVSVAFGTSRRLPMSLVMKLVLPSLWMNPPALFLWVPGLYWLLRSPQAARVRPLAWAFLAAWAVVLVTGAKVYYLIPAHIPILAAGAVALEGWLKTTGRVVIMGAVTAAGLFWLPLGIPFLDLPTFDRYSAYAWPPMGDKNTGKGPGMYSARQVTYGTRFGWEETTRKVADVYFSLPEAERSSAVILTQRYFTAAPLNVLGAPLGLPRVISADVEYWLWGPGRQNAETALLIGFDEQDARKLYGEVTRIERPLKTAFEWESLTVLVCRKPKISLAAAWPALRTLGEVVLPNGVVAPAR